MLMIFKRLWYSNANDIQIRIIRKWLWLLNDYDFQMIMLCKRLCYINANDFQIRIIHK